MQKRKIVNQNTVFVLFSSVPADPLIWNNPLMSTAEGRPSSVPSFIIIWAFFLEVGRLSKNSFWSDNQFRCLTFIPYTENLFQYREPFPFSEKNWNSRSAFLYIMFVKLMPKCVHSMGENDRGHELFGSIILTPEEYLMNWPFIMKEPNLHYLKC